MSRTYKTHKTVVGGRYIIMLTSLCIDKFIQRRSCASKHLRQRNTSEQIEQV